MRRLAVLYDIGCAAIGMGKRFRQETLRHVRLHAGDQVLDVGCGTGVLTCLVAEAVGPTGSVIGIDPSAQMRRQAIKNAAHLNIKPQFKEGVIEALPFETGRFDLVLSSMMLHHLPLQLKRQGLGEVFRVLKPGGCLVLVDFDKPGNPLWWLVIWPCLLIPMLAANLRGEVGTFLQDAGFHSIQRVGRWLRLISFWSAVKPYIANKVENKIPSNE